MDCFVLQRNILIPDWGIAPCGKPFPTGSFSAAPNLSYNFQFIFKLVSSHLILPHCTQRGNSRSGTKIARLTHFSASVSSSLIPSSAQIINHVCSFAFLIATSCLFCSDLQYVNACIAAKKKKNLLGKEYCYCTFLLISNVMKCESQALVLMYQQHRNLAFFFVLLRPFFLVKPHLLAWFIVP